MAQAIDLEASARLQGLSSAAAAALTKGDFASAKACCIRMLETNPDFADAYYYLGVLAGEGGRNRAAVDTLRKAIALDPERPRYHAQLARFMLPAGCFSDAILHASRAWEAGIDDAYQLDTIGCVLSQAGLQQQAEQAFRKATKRAPDNWQYRYNHASCLRFLGSFEAAEHGFEACIRLRPGHYRAHWALSHLRTQTRASNHIPRLRAVLRKMATDSDAQSFLNCALGKECEDLEEYDLAFEHYAAAAAARRRMVDYDTRHSEALIEALIRRFDAAFFASATRGCGSTEPIFVFGMPRSGTTLVERIITSHSEVVSAGELLNFGIEVKRASGLETLSFLDESTIAGAATLDWGALGHAYIESTHPVTAATGRFTDKLPFNFLYLGFIAKALPAATLVHVQRGAMDTCFSMFKQRFAMAYNYSYSLEEMGDYYLLYLRLMDHWREVSDVRILEVGYEDLVARQAATSRELIANCQLEWQADCLEFHTNEAAVATASASQVREPIYRSSLGKWRKFERYLAPLRETLERGGVDTG